MQKKKLQVKMKIKTIGEEKDKNGNEKKNMKKEAKSHRREERRFIINKGVIR